MIGVQGKGATKKNKKGLRHTTHGFCASRYCLPAAGNFGCCGWLKIKIPTNGPVYVTVKSYAVAVIAY